MMGDIKRNMIYMNNSLPVTCSYCGALPNEPCTIRNSFRKQYHEIRYKAYLKYVEYEEASWEDAPWPIPSNIVEFRDYINNLIDQGYKRIYFDAGPNNVRPMVSKTKGIG
jgi:hypothetical protein